MGVFPRQLSTLLSEIGSLVEPRAVCSAQLDPEPQGSSCPCLPNPRVTGAWAIPGSFGFFYMGSEDLSGPQTCKASILLTGYIGCFFCCCDKIP